MKISLFGKTLTVIIRFGDDEVTKRRELAYKVDRLAKAQYARGLSPYLLVQISRIKAARHLNVVGDDYGATSLKAAKEWVESAFLDNGKGDIA